MVENNEAPEAGSGEETVKRVGEIAVSRFQSEFPDFTNVVDVLGSGHSILLFGSPPKARKTALATNLKVNPDSLGSLLGRVNPTRPESFRTEWWVGSWEFPKGNLGEADKAAQRAVTHTLSFESHTTLEEKKFHRIRNSDFQSLMKRLGYQEGSEMEYLADMVVYDLLKNKDFEIHLAEYQRLSEYLINQKVNDARNKARAGFLIAKARIYHLANEPVISKSLIHNTRMIAREWSYENLSRLLDDLFHDRTIFWDKYEL